MSYYTLPRIYNNISRWCYSKMEPKKAAAIVNPYIFMETAPGKIMGSLHCWAGPEYPDIPPQLVVVGAGAVAP